MKHLKSYKIFESQEILSAGLENAVRNNNLQLIKDLVEQHNLDPSMYNNKALEIAFQNANKEIVEYLVTFPTVTKKDRNTKEEILKDAEKFDIINAIQDKVKKI